MQTEFLVLQYPVFTLIFFPIIGMFEEVFFRGILQNLIMKNLSNHTNGNLPAVLAILSSSLIFTALHAFQYGVKVLIVVFALSLILGSSYAIFKSLKLNMFAHMLNNIAGVIAILITSGSLGTTKIIAAHDMDNL